MLTKNKTSISQPQISLFWKLISHSRRQRKWNVLNIIIPTRKLSNLENFRSLKVGWWEWAPRVKKMFFFNLLQFTLHYSTVFYFTLSYFTFLKSILLESKCGSGGGVVFSNYNTTLGWQNLVIEWHEHSGPGWDIYGDTGNQFPTKSLNSQETLILSLSLSDIPLYWAKCQKMKWKLYFTLFRSLLQWPT